MSTNQAQQTAAQRFLSMGALAFSSGAPRTLPDHEDFKNETAAVQWQHGYDQARSVMPLWHSFLPLEGMAQTPAQLKQDRDAYRTIGLLLAMEAWDAISVFHRDASMRLLASYLPATHSHNGLVRMVPEDQVLREGWKLLSEEKIAHFAMTREMFVYKIGEMLRRAPVLAAESLTPI